MTEKKKIMDAPARATLHELFRQYDLVRTNNDAMYQFMTTPDYGFRLRIILSLEKYYRQEWQRELSNTAHTDFANMFNRVFAIALQKEESMLSRNVQLMILMFACATDAKIAQYYCQLPPSEPDICRCDRLAYTHFSTHLLDLVESVFVKKEDTADTFINKCLLLYTALLPSHPPDYVNRPAMPRIRPPDVT